MTAFTTVGPWRSDAQEMWKWFEPALLPTVLLLIGSYIATENAPDAETRTADRHLFRTTLGLSIAYLALLAIALLVGYRSVPAMNTISVFDLPLRFLNVITNACIGYFLVSTRK